jgi:hypothetical protein
MNGIPFEPDAHVNGSGNGHAATAEVAPVHPIDLVMQSTDHNSGRAWPALDEPWSDPATDELEEQQSRLQVDIAAAKQRIAAAQHLAATRDAQMRAAMREELVRMRTELADLERHHEDQLAGVRARTQAEVDRILAAARDTASKEFDDVVGPD